MNSWPPSFYLNEAEKRGVSQGVAERALEAANSLHAAGLPAIITLGHLAYHTDAPLPYLRSVIGRCRDPYRVFSIHKRTGGVRHICVSEPELADIQQWITRYVLSGTRAHAASHAYAPGSSIQKCASMHAGCRWLVKMDIQQFFESVSEIQVYRVFRGLGYPSLVSFELGRLTTRVVRSVRRWQNPVWSRKSPLKSRIAKYHSESLGHLPQGASTSPMLANLAMMKFDEQVTGLAGGFKVTYTRYSDDLVFSTVSKDFTREKARQLVKAVYRAMSEHGLRPHTAKTLVIPPGARKVVLGLIVNSERPRLSEEFRRRMESHVHYIRKFGPTAHSQKRGFHSVLGLRRHIEGCLSFAASVDGAFSERLSKELADIDWPL